MPHSRNIVIVFGTDPEVIRGGLHAPDTMTNAQFLTLLQVLIKAPRGGFYTCKEGSNLPVQQNNEILPHGRYIIFPDIQGQIVEVSDKRYYHRTLSRCNTRRDATFIRDVRRRDGGCMITGFMNREIKDDRWIGFETAHIIPLSLSDSYLSSKFQAIIPDKKRGINSPNNGILLNSEIHQLWDSYSLAINPHDGYRVQSFRPNSHRYHNIVLNTACRRPNDPHRVIDALFTWHFEQAVLYNMRGDGEPTFEFDCPPGSDIMGVIREGPLPAERMEAELFGRLYGLSDDNPQSGP